MPKFIYSMDIRRRVNLDYIIEFTISQHGKGWRVCAHVEGKDGFIVYDEISTLVIANTALDELLK